MKKCPYCAEEIQDQAIVCKHCGRDIQKRAGVDDLEEAYSKVPSFRRSSVASVLVLLGLIPCVGTLSMLAVCLILITGPIYYKQLDNNGRLKQWSRANTLAAWVILLLQLAGVLWFSLEPFMLGRSSNPWNPYG